MAARRKIHRKLFVEELEPRVAPSGLTIGPSGEDATFRFLDADGDEVLITLQGSPG